MLSPIGKVGRSRNRDRGKKTRDNQRTKSKSTGRSFQRTYQRGPKPRGAEVPGGQKRKRMFTGDREDLEA